jgi:hypothetical protein
MVQGNGNPLTQIWNCQVSQCSLLMLQTWMMPLSQEFSMSKKDFFQLVWSNLQELGKKGLIEVYH